MKQTEVAQNAVIYDRSGQLLVSWPTKTAPSIKKVCYDIYAFILTFDF